MSVSNLTTLSLIWILDSDQILHYSITPLLQHPIPLDLDCERKIGE